MTTSNTRPTDGPFKVAIHSFKGGTGKSTIAANLAVSLALEGRNVGVMDLDLAGPGLHVLLELKQEDIKLTLNDFFLDKCSAVDPVIDLTKRLGLKKGKLVFVPASFRADDIVRVLSKGYGIQNFRIAIQEISRLHNLDCMIIDTHPGIDKSTLVAMGVCDIIVLISRIDSQDILGTGVMIEIANTLKKPGLLLANMIPPGVDREKVKQRLETLFNSPVTEAIPFYTEVLRALSTEVFILKNPDHDFALRLKNVVKVLQASARAT
jgi:septum site-determining protein MinD